MPWFLSPPCEFVSNPADISKSAYWDVKVVRRPSSARWLLRSQLDERANSSSPGCFLSASRSNRLFLNAYDLLDLHNMDLIMASMLVVTIITSSLQCGYVAYENLPFCDQEG